MLDRSAKRGIFSRIRLVIVDRQPIVLQGLKSILGAQPDFEIVASCRDATSGLQAIRNLTPDAALLADTLPDLTVAEILAIAKAEKLFARLVFFTENEFESDHDLTAALAAGACSVISKYASPDSMLRQLSVISKHSVPPEPFEHSPLGQEANGGGKIEKMLEQLTHRERQIVRLVSEGMSNKEIARQLNVSPGTVKVHLYNIFQKLEITNRTVLATLALLRHPSGFGTLALAFLAFAIADDLKASEASDLAPEDNGIGHTGEHAGYQLWKKAILRGLIRESGETSPLIQSDLLAKLSQATRQVPIPTAAMEVLRAAEHSAGAKPWKDGGPVGSSSPDLPAPSPRGTSDTQFGRDPGPDYLLPRLASNPSLSPGGYGTSATLNGALIFALNDPHLAVQPHHWDHASIDSSVVAGENATTKLAAITKADVGHVDNSAPGLAAHESRLPSAVVTTGNEGVAAEGARSQMGHGAEGETLQKSGGAVDAGHDAGTGRDQLAGGNIDKNILYRSQANSNSTSSSSAFDFGSEVGGINLAAFGALAWLHMTAASKSIPPHTLAWIYDPASNETIVYVNPTDGVLDIGDRGLLEVHLQGVVSIAEPDVVDQRDGAVVAVTLEKLQEAMISATALDDAVLSADNDHQGIGTSGSALGTAAAWSILADDGLRFQFAQARTGSGEAARFITVAGDSAEATQESDNAPAVSAHGSSITPAPGATAPTVENPTLKSAPINADTGILPTSPNNVVVEPTVATTASADQGHSQNAPDPGPAKAAATEPADAGVKPGNGVDHSDHAPDSDAAPRSAKTAEPGQTEHGKSHHSNSAQRTEDAAIVEPSVATAADADRGHSHHASEPASAKAPATELTEADVKPGNGTGHGTQHHAPASDAAPESAKAADPGGVEHGKSGHSSSAHAPEAAAIVEPDVATTGSAGHGHSQHASEPASAKAPAIELTEAGVVLGNNDSEQQPLALDAAAAVKTAEPAVAEHGKSEHDSHASSADAPEAAVLAEPSVAAGNVQQAVESAAIVPVAAQPAQAASAMGGADKEPAFRFDTEATPSTPVAAVELKELNQPIKPHGLHDQKDDLETIASMVPSGLDEHAANHGNSGAHHAIVSAPHDLLI